MIVGRASGVSGDPQCMRASCEVERLVASWWVVVWLPTGNPLAATQCQKLGFSRTYCPFGKNVAVACLASNVLTIEMQAGTLKPSSNVSATALTVRGPCVTKVAARWTQPG